MKISEFEIGLKQHITRIHQELFGAGPKNVYVRLVRDTLVVKINGSLTPLERKLLVEQGRDYVVGLRRSLVAAHMRDLDPTEFVCEVLDYHMVMIPEADSLYFFMVLKENLEQMLLNQAVESPLLVAFEHK